MFLKKIRDKGTPVPPAPVPPANISKIVITTGNLLAQFKYITGDAEKLHSLH